MFPIRSIHAEGRAHEMFFYGRMNCIWLIYLIQWVQAQILKYQVITARYNYSSMFRKRYRKAALTVLKRNNQMQTQVKSNSQSSPL